MIEDSERVQMQFDDNSLLPQLYGDRDRHLEHIERELGVSLVSRGNKLAITGPHQGTDAARSAISHLYQSLKRGNEIDAAAVDAALKNAGLQAHQRWNESDEIRTRKRRIAPRGANQAAYLRALRTNELVFGIGPAGTGKTYLAVAMAIDMLMSGSVERIVLSRPAVEAGERLGFLPGDMREKVDPYLRPLYDALHDMLPGDQVIKRLSSGEIEIAPLAFMRGRTLANAFVILDEAQNTTAVQMKMFLTRLGEGSRMAVTGDLSQVDLPRGTKSGLADALETLEGESGIGVIHFNDADIVRHALVARIVRAYDRHDRKTRRKKDDAEDV